MKAFLPILLFGAATPALAQAPDAQNADPHAGHDMHGMDMKDGDTPPPDVRSAPAPAPDADPHAHHHAADTAAPADRGTSPLTGTDQPVGNAAPPPVVHDLPAERYWDPAAMRAAAEAEMHPAASRYAKLVLDLAEYQFRKGKDGYRWEGEAWFGDLDRFVIKSRGEGTLGEGVEQAEVEALYAKALDPWWNLELGVRQDIRPRPVRTWATIGVEGHAPYQLQVQAAAYLSDKGQLTGRIEGAYDQRITQRLILQPRLELNLSAQDMPAERIGAGLSTAELGLRLRYELQREFAPYVGINWTWASGTTADYARVDGHGTSERSVVAGIRFWF